jgi:putative transposase
MTNIRRYYIPNSTVFITAVCYKRTPLLQPNGEKERLLNIMREVKRDLPFRMLAYVILDDHFHWILKPESGNFSKIMQSIKLRFARRFIKDNQIMGNSNIWQRRFWDHVIRDDSDFHRHLDYIHYNPVKHGYVSKPHAYSWSSFPNYVDKGYYQLNWGSDDVPENLRSLDFE